MTKKVGIDLRFKGHMSKRKGHGGITSHGKFSNLDIAVKKCMKNKSMNVFAYLVA